MVLKKLGRYDIVGVLGKGAMGLVYEARDPNLDRRVAIKTIMVDNLSQKAADEYAMRFRTEARSAARLQHPNIVSVYDSDRHQDIAYLVMEFVQGEDLKQHIDEGKVFTLEQSLHMMRDLLAALDYAHVRHVIHRDVKPANLLVEPNGRVKLTDFGVARMQDSGEGTRTRGSMVGTLKYMSPEQVQGQLVDARTDIFAAGVVLYQLLTGRRPFDGESEFAIIQQIISTTPPPPSSINPMLPAALDDVVARSLAKSRDQRFESAREFALALREAGGLAQDQTIALPIGSASSSIFGSAGSEAQRSRTSGSTVRLSRQPDGSHSTVTQELELVYWKDVKDSDDKQDLLGFLDRFPSGIYADLARRRLRRWGTGLAADPTASLPGGAVLPATGRSGQAEATLLAREETLLMARDGITPVWAPPAPRPVSVLAAASAEPAKDLVDGGQVEPLVEGTDSGKTVAVDDLAAGTDNDTEQASGTSAANKIRNAVGADGSSAASAVSGSGSVSGDGDREGDGFDAAQGGGSDALVNALATVQDDAANGLAPATAIAAADAIAVETTAPSAAPDPEDTPQANADVVPEPADPVQATNLPSGMPMASDMPQPEPVAATVPAKAPPLKLLMVLASVAVMLVAALWYVLPRGVETAVEQTAPAASVDASPAAPASSDPVAGAGTGAADAASPGAAPVVAAPSSAAVIPQAAALPAKSVAQTKPVVAPPAVAASATVAVPATAVPAAAAVAAPTPAPSPQVPAASASRAGIAKVGANDIASSLAPSAPPSPGGLEAACEGRVLLGYQSCMSEQCAKPIFADHPTCVQRRAAEQARKAQQSNRN